MPLLLNNEPWNIPVDELAKYQLDTIYRVGLQFIKPTKDRQNSRPFDIGKPHIQCEYNHSIIDDKGRRISLGRLIYCEAYNDNPEGQNRKKVTTPPYVEIGDIGVKQVSGYNYELNYFLANHPQNEVVKNDATHPNHNPKGETIFSTYLAEKVADKRMARHEMIADVMNRLVSRNPDRTHILSHNDLKSIAVSMIDMANENALSVFELVNYDNIDERTLRERLCTVAGRYPFEVNEAMKMQTTDFLAHIHEWMESETLRVVGDQWVHFKNKTNKEVICKIPEGKEATSVLATYFAERDERGKMFKAVRSSHEKYKAAMAATN